MNGRYALIAAALVVALCCTPVASHAQAMVGGGGGTFQQGITWAQQNIVVFVAFAGIVAVGGALMFFRAHPMWVMSAIAGVIVLGAALTLAGQFGGVG